MTVDLWASRSARLVLFGPGGDRDVILPGPATVIVDGHWVTLQRGEARYVRSESGVYRLATEADVTLPAHPS